MAASCPGVSPPAEERRPSRALRVPTPREWRCHNAAHANGVEVLSPRKVVPKGDLPRENRAKGYVSSEARERGSEGRKVPEAPCLPGRPGRGARCGLAGGGLPRSNWCSRAAGRGRDQCPGSRRAVHSTRDIISESSGTRPTPTGCIGSEMQAQPRGLSKKEKFGFFAVSGSHKHLDSFPDVSRRSGHPLLRSDRFVAPTPAKTGAPPPLLCLAH